MKYFTLIIILLLISLSAFAQEEKEYKMTEYFFVELIRNPDKLELDSLKIAEIQAAHMANMGQMVEDGALVCAGPFGDGEGGGIWILKVPSYEAAEKYCKNDPAIKNNRLNYKIRSWWTAEGTFILENKN